MNTLTIHGQHRAGKVTSRILVGEKIQDVEKYIETPKTVIITDRNVNHHYGRYFPAYNLIELGTGEKIKNLDTVRHIYRELLDFGADRSTFILGIGGGVVCDIAGFAASTFMRGLPFGFVSTTLLSQVDASVGGKNGVNFEGYKNMVGVFNQPRFVICDQDMLRTLPAREVSSGLAEIVKHAAIGNADLFSYLEKNHREALAMNRQVLEKIIYDSIVVKAGVVERDEREVGERRKLNFGHTFGHAIEKIKGIPHGEAVSIGMVLAAELSVQKKLIPPDQGKRIVDLLGKLELPTSIDVDKGKLLDAVGKDKKKKEDIIHFVFLRAIGDPLVRGIPLDELKGVIHDMR